MRALYGHSQPHRDATPSNSSFAGRNFSPSFCSSLHQAREFKGEREERGDCTFDSALFRGILRSNVVLRGRKPCNVARACAMSWGGKLFLSIYSPLSFSLPLRRHRQTNSRECHSPKDFRPNTKLFRPAASLSPSPSGAAAAAAFLVDVGRSFCAAAAR